MLNKQKTPEDFILSIIRHIFFFLSLTHAVRCCYGNDDTVQVCCIWKNRHIAAVMENESTRPIFCSLFDVESEKERFGWEMFPVWRFLILSGLSPMCVCVCVLCCSEGGDVVKVAQLASITSAQSRIAQTETPVTLQFQGNKFTLSPSQLRQLTTGQPLQLQGTVTLRLVFLLLLPTSSVHPGI